MDNKKIKIFLQAGLAIGIAVLFLIPVQMVVATDTTPPVISNIQRWDQEMWIGLTESYIYFGFSAYDNVALADVRVIITGPNGFTPVNESVLDSYEYYFDAFSGLGTYHFYIWAKDTSNNVACSPIMHTIILDSLLPEVWVDDDNTNGQMDGTVQHPFVSIQDGLSAVEPYGTVHVRNGLYHGPLFLNAVHLLGESQENVIIAAPPQGYENIVEINSYVEVANVTVRNLPSGRAFNFNNEQPTHNNILRNCNIYNVYSGIGGGQVSNSSITACRINNTNMAIYVGGTYRNYTISGCTIANNQRGFHLATGSWGDLYITHCTVNNNEIGFFFSGATTPSHIHILHNNIINNIQNVNITIFSSHNVWNDTVTGNYWSNFQDVYPNAHIMTATGTWDTPYTIDANNIDHHPWVYPDGYIDTITPTVEVIYPNGGETVNDSITITWTATDDLTSNLDGTIWISYSADAGSTWHTIASHIANSGSYVWDTNTVADGAQYLIKVNGSDEFRNIGSDESNGVFIIMNHPNTSPEIPALPVGQTNGYVNVSYTYTTNTTDVDGDQVYYKWSWGAEESDWMGPYTSGETISAVHAWSVVGSYSVKVKAKDVNGAESNWSQEVPVTINKEPEVPKLIIDSITGGFGISAVIKNNGSVDATNISWSIALDGGFILRGGNTTGVIDKIPEGGEAVISSGLIIGLGRIPIIVSATCDEGASAKRTASGFVFLIFVIGIQ
jgi:hypothetical protein